MVKETKRELIDKQEFISYIRKYIWRVYQVESLDLRLSVTEFFALLHGAPVVEENAEWIYQSDKNHWICSWCTMRAFCDDSGAIVRTKYCPCCGRKMRRDR